MTTHILTFPKLDLEYEWQELTGHGFLLEAKKQGVMVKILKFRSDVRVSYHVNKINSPVAYNNSLVNFQDMLSCLITDTIYAEEQKLISLLGLYVKAATLRLELFDE